MLSNGPIDKSVFNPFSSTQPLENSLRKSYNSLLNINVEPTPWYKDLNNLWWLGGLLVKGAVAVGVVYLGYKFIIDPLFIESIDKGKGVDRISTNIDIAQTAGASPSKISPSTEGSLTPTNVEGATIFNSIKSVFSNNLKKLNPAYWFINSSDIAANTKTFLSLQQSGVNRMEHLYPFTEVNPYDSWIKRMRIYYLGETIFEQTGRERLAKSYLDGMFPAVRTATPVPSGSTITVATSVASSSAATPSTSTVGLGLSFTPEFAQTAGLLYSVPSTPTTVPVSLIGDNLLPEFENGFNNPVGDAVNRLNSPELDDIPMEAAAATVTVVSYNKYSVLDVE